MKQRLDVHALPGAGTGSIGVDPKGSDSDPRVVSLFSRFEAGNLEKNGGDGVSWPQVNPQQSAQDVLGLDLWTEAEQAAGGQRVLGDGVSWKQSEKCEFISFPADFWFPELKSEQGESQLN